MADSVETELRMELELCKLVLKAIERRHKESLRSQKVVAKTPRLLLESGEKLVEKSSHTTGKDGTH